MYSFFTYFPNIYSFPEFLLVFFCEYLLFSCTLGHLDFLREKNLFTASRIRQKLQICFNRFTEPFSL